MSNTTTSPNMGLPVPVVSTDPGPDWANNINASLGIIDGHSHAPGSGVPVNPAGININSNLAFNNNNATTVGYVQFTPQVSQPVAAVNCLYESGVDLYYNDGTSQIRITSGGSVAGSTGTITGLPSGSASAAFSGGTFTFQSATSTPAAINAGPVSIGNQTASAKTITLNVNNAIASNYNVYFPAALPASTNYLTLDVSGNIGVNSSGFTGSGAVVLAQSPTFSGNPAGTITANTFSPTLVWSQAGVSVSTSAWYYQRIGPIVLVHGFLNVAGTIANTTFITATIPVATSSLVVAGQSSFLTTGTTLTSYNLTNLSTTRIETSPGAMNIGASLAQLTFSYMYQVV